MLGGPGQSATRVSSDYRVDLGPVLTYGFQGFIGQTNAFLWGKRHYPDGENGGISGIVFYAVTRAENDPRYAAAEVWEPGIPGVTVESVRRRRHDPAQHHHHRQLGRDRSPPAASMATAWRPARSCSPQTAPNFFRAGLLGRPAHVQPGAAGGLRRRLRLRCDLRRPGSTGCRTGAMRGFAEPHAGRRLRRRGHRARRATRSSSPRTRTSTSATSTTRRPRCCRAPCVGDPHLVPRLPDPLPGRPDRVLAWTTGFAGTRASALRPQARHPVGRRQRGRRLLALHRGAGGRPRPRLHPRRHPERVRPQLAELRREVRAALRAGHHP